MNVFSHGFRVFPFQIAKKNSLHLIKEVRLIKSVSFYKKKSCPVDPSLYKTYTKESTHIYQQTTLGG